MAPKTMDLVPCDTLSRESQLAVEMHPQLPGGVLLGESAVQAIVSPINRRVPGLGRIVQVQAPAFEPAHTLEHHRPDL
jgi:hypothetical protein